MAHHLNDDLMPVCLPVQVRDDNDMYELRYYMSGAPVHRKETQRLNRTYRAIS